MLSRRLSWVLILSLLWSCTAAALDPEHVSNVTVTFVESEKFTDVRRNEWEQNSRGLLSDLAKFIQETGEHSLPPDMHLFIKIADIKLAEDFEPWLGPSFNQTRIVKSIYPPRIVLEFRLQDAGGRVVKEGKQELTDVDYQRDDTYLREDYLRYEKNLLRYWFRDEFGDLSANVIKR